MVRLPDHPKLVRRRDVAAIRAPPRDGAALPARPILDGHELPGALDGVTGRAPAPAPATAGYGGDHRAPRFLGSPKAPRERRSARRRWYVLI